MCSDNLVCNILTIQLREREFFVTRSLFMLPSTIAAIAGDYFVAYRYINMKIIAPGNTLKTEKENARMKERMQHTRKKQYHKSRKGK